VPLSDEQRHEAVALLAEMLLDAARKREGVPSGGGFAGGLGGAFADATSVPDESAKQRKAA
jgi:hypothetical protein